MVQTLAEHGYRDRTHRAYLQCFDAQELRRIRNDLHCALPLVQLIGENAWAEGPDDCDAMRTAAGLR